MDVLVIISGNVVIISVIVMCFSGVCFMNYVFWLRIIKRLWMIF